MPTDPRLGSGCTVPIRNLEQGLTALGIDVELIRPRLDVPNFTLRRLLFNQGLRFADFSRFDLTVGIDLDGYACPRIGPNHVAYVKGVLADATRFETGWTRWSMEMQARLEARHVHRADKVLTDSQYCAATLRRYYDFAGPISVVPEAIDLDAWKQLFREHGAASDPNRFTVLCVCRLFPRKRVDVLLRAAALALRSAPELRVRVVGDGPSRNALRRLSNQLDIDRVVEWLGAIPRRQLARELTAAHAFCLPSAQEGFGIVFLEAMAAGLPIVAARAAAIPEVIPQALLCPPDNVECFSDALLALYTSDDLRDRLARAGEQQVARFSLPVVTAAFLDQIESLVKNRGS